MKRLIYTIAAMVLAATAIAQISQPGGITGNLGGSGAAVGSNNAFTGNNSFSGTQTFTGTNTVASAEPQLFFRETDAGTDQKLWGFDVNSNLFCLKTFTDAGGGGANVFCETRGAGVNPTTIAFGSGANPAYSFIGTGTATFGGALVAATITLTNYTLNGVIFKYPTQQSTGTKFTTTGCSVSATTGGGSAGIFTLGANTCTVIITMNGATGATATNGWTCQAHDRTAPTILIGGETTSTATTASIAIPAGAGATDVIGFSCVGF